MENALEKFDRTKTLKIRFERTEYWLLSQDSLTNSYRCISPLNHCDENGELLPAVGLFGESYALLTWDGRILRYNEVIGTVDDIELV